MRLLLFLSALLTGLTGLLPGTGPVGARQVAQASAVAIAEAAVVVRAEPVRPAATLPSVVQAAAAPLAPRAAPVVDVRARVDSALE